MAQPDGRDDSPSGCAAEHLALRIALAWMKPRVAPREGDCRTQDMARHQSISSAPRHQDETIARSWEHSRRGGAL
ncbi:MAG: hypothetical protein H0W99_06610 [Acidobacteria bacterium]|nr:hypothetical protein [Acidobacteriota bacterium]